MMFLTRGATYPGGWRSLSLLVLLWRFVGSGSLPGSDCRLKKTKAWGDEKILIAAIQTSIDGFIEVSNEMTRPFNDGTIAGPTREDTTPTRFEDFADELARAYGR